MGPRKANMFNQSSYSFSVKKKTCCPPVEITSKVQKIFRLESVIDTDFSHSQRLEEYTVNVLRGTVGDFLF